MYKMYQYKNYITAKKNTPCVKSKGHRMHDSDAISILICAFDSPCFFPQHNVDGLLLSWP